ncbi:MAG: hypothetical protein KKG09_04605 [Verrucomicrobia bacterium]|nr:hypothetical protein [Verrucomicrobiota bacterium]MBU4289452.1 hypothetical protein [Verrucomicrobiota bacterium]MBU4428722.1 hypothetical protein [Verrucomicrobiota bacterium]MBU4497266.1 hypothetical protein [Verrucomicrobiota bacterium]MCG2679159.1 hypothetical protein [Kiritimatiellia bacterium]
MSKTPEQMSLLDLMRPPDGQRLRVAVLTTYDLDLKYLEGVILPTLVGVDTVGADLESQTEKCKDYLLELRSRLRNSDVLVLADKGRFDFSIKKGLETYELLFAENYPAFHPKLFLLAFDRDFRMAVSSANITESGFHSNLEVLWMASSEFGDKFEQAGRDALDFLSCVAQREWPSSQVFKEILGKLRKRIPKGRGHARLLHSERALPLVKQWRHEIGQHKYIEDLHIVSPFFDQGGRMGPLSEFGKPNIHLYLTERPGKAKPEYRLPISKQTLARIQPECCVISNQWMIGCGQNSGANKKATDIKTRILHAKIYAAKSGKYGWALLGSPNFTNRALLAAGGQRNAEAAIALTGKWIEIARMLPPVAMTVPWQDIVARPSEEDITQAGWLPFLTSAEYDATRKVLRLVFSSRKPAGNWSVWYESNQMLSGKKIGFPRKKELHFTLHEDSCLMVMEGQHKGSFPIGVIDKEMLPELPGMDALDYDTILEMLAHGVVNLRHLLARARERQTANATVEKETPNVPYMDLLSRFTKAMENLKKRLSGSISTRAEARALFDGDLGLNRIAVGLTNDQNLDIAFRHFALLEMQGMLASIQWKGEKDPRSLASRFAKRSLQKLQRQVVVNERKFDHTQRKLTKIRNFYTRVGAEGWHRK